MQQSIWSLTGVSQVRTVSHLVPTIRSDFAFPVTKIKLLSILASEDGLKNVEKEFPELEVAFYSFCPSLADIEGAL